MHATGAPSVQSLTAVRASCGRVYGAALEGRAPYWVVREERLGAAVDELVSLVNRDYALPCESDEGHVTADGQSKASKYALAAGRIPPHSRVRHFAPLDEAITSDPCALVDLVVVAVLLDAGAGTAWKYADAATKKTYTRSEGLAVAVQRYFEHGGFSDDGKSIRADASRLAAMSLDCMQDMFQVSDSNVLPGMNGRLALLHRLAEALRTIPSAFGRGQRPSDFVDPLLRDAITEGGLSVVPISLLWDRVIIGGFGKVWPQSRTKVDGVSVGDAWPIELKGETPFVVSFHKLSQWLTYSLVEVLESALPVRVSETHLLTGLPEYRNGGFFVDTGVLTLSSLGQECVARGPVPQDHALVVEWRALTVALIDRTAEALRSRLGLSAEDLPLAKVLEAGTWKAGREIAARLRPDGGSPIPLALDGTLF